MTKLQAYHIYEKVKRNKYCIIPVAKFVKGHTRNGLREAPANRALDNSPSKSAFGSATHLTEAVQPTPLDAMNAIQMTSGESDQLFDEDYESDQGKLNMVNDEEEDEDLISDEDFKSPGTANQGVETMKTLKIGKSGQIKDGQMEEGSNENLG